MKTGHMARWNEPAAALPMLDCRCMRKLMERFRSNGPGSIYNRSSFAATGMRGETLEMMRRFSQ